jgi:hypothetical protein
MNINGVRTHFSTADGPLRDARSMKTGAVAMRQIRCSWKANSWTTSVVLLLGTTSLGILYATSPIPVSGELLEFKAGDVAIAADVNQNFSLLQSTLGRVETDIADLLIRIQDLTGDAIRDDSLTAADVKDGSLTGTDIQNGTLTSAEIRDGSVTGIDLENETVTGQNVMDFSLSGSDISTLSGDVTFSNGALTILDVSRLEPIIFDPSLSGDASVVLPVDAVSASETLDEPGVAGFFRSQATTLTGSAVVDALVARDITVPAQGFVLAIGTLSAGSQDFFQVFAVSDDPLVLPPEHGNLITQVDSGLTSVAVQGLFPVSAAGTHTFFLVGRGFAPPGTGEEVQSLQLTLLYFPTQYGPVSSNP